MAVFFTPLAGDAVLLREDRSMFSKRIEVLCATCHSHLGHVFEGEGYDDAHRPALLHQLDLASAGAEPSRQPRATAGHRARLPARRRATRGPV